MLDEKLYDVDKMGDIILQEMIIPTSQTFKIYSIYGDVKIEYSNILFIEKYPDLTKITASSELKKLSKIPEKEFESEKVKI